MHHKNDRQAVRPGTTLGVDEWRLTRREFLYAAGLAAAAPLLAACGSGAGSSDGLSAVGSVTRAEIGGDGLVVHSTRQLDAAVGADGAFTTVVSPDGAQLLTVSDGAGKLRALALSLPSAASASRLGQAPTLAFDAESTAVALIFLTPGILVVEPAEAAQRVSEIRALPGFGDLVASLKGSLAATPLGDQIGDDTFQALVRGCVETWQAGRAVRAGSRSHRSADDTAAFNARFGNGPDSNREVVFTNAAWRWVNVVRQELDAKGNELRQNPNPHGLAHAMTGATSGSWGSLFTGTTGQPGEGEDHVALADSLTASLKYWVRGPGFGLTSGSETLPATVTDTTGTMMAWGLSIVMYLLIPCFDLSEGGHFLGHATSEPDFAALTDFISGLGAPLTHTIAAAMEGDVEGVARGIANVVAAIFSNIRALITALGFSAVTAVRVSRAIAAGGIAFGAANAMIAIAYWAVCPAVSSLELPVSSGQVVVQ